MFVPETGNFALKIAIIVNILKYGPMDMPLTITEKAYQEIIKIRDNKKIPEKYGLRIGIKGGGCAGISYLLGFDTANEGDGTFQVNGLPVYIAKKHTMHLIGLILDYYEGSDAKGFLFSKEATAD